MEVQTLAFIVLMTSIVLITALRFATNYMEWKFEMKKLDRKEEMKNEKAK